MEHSSVARKTAGAIYLVLTLLWGIIAAIIGYNLGLAELGSFHEGELSSSLILFLTFSFYTLLSLLLAFLLLTKLSFRSGALKAILGLALLPLLLAPFAAVDLYGAIVYLIPYYFTYQFYKESKSLPVKRLNHLRRVK